MVKHARAVPAELDDLVKELPITLTKEQAVEVLHITLRQFTRLVQRGDIKIVKTSPGRSGRVLVTRSEVVRFMSERLT